MGIHILAEQLLLVFLMEMDRIYHHIRIFNDFREHSTENFQKHLTMSLKFTRTWELAYHRITACTDKLKGVLHSQEDGTNIFPSQLLT